MKCVVCETPLKKGRLCDSCYESFMDTGSDWMACITWAAERARYFARRKPLTRKRRK